MTLEEYNKWRARFNRTLEEATELEVTDRVALRNFLETPTGARLITYLFMLNQSKAKNLMSKMTTTDEALDKNWWIGNIHGTNLILETLIGTIVTEKPDDRPVEPPV